MGKSDAFQSPFPWRIFSRIVLIQTGLVIAALTGSGITARYFLKRQFTSQSQYQLEDTLRTLSQNFPEAPSPGWCAMSAAQTTLHFTLIAWDGRVLCDSHHDSKIMDNYLDRPEVMQVRIAHANIFAYSVRHNNALQEDMLYGALALKKKHIILCAAIPFSHLYKTLRVFDISLLAVLILAAVVACLFAVWDKQSLLSQIRRLLIHAQEARSNSSETKIHDPGLYGEWIDLESLIESLKKDLAAKTESLTTQQDELATLMSAVSDAVLAIDLDKVPLFYNSQFEVLFSDARLRQGPIHLWEMFRTPEILHTFSAALGEGTSSTVKPILFDTGSGRRFLTVSVSPLRRRGGDIYGAVGIFHDVTELKVAEQIRIDFVANVSHELRTPLTAVKGYTDTLIQDVQEGKAMNSDFLQVISRNTSRLMGLMNDLLDLSALESTDVLQKSMLSTEEVTTQIVEQMCRAFDDKSQRVAIEVQAPTVFADPRRLEQVLVNLLDNAHKYTPVHGEIMILWEPGLDTDVWLKVRDTGPGVPQEHHVRLFERFYRVDKARSRELGGTGLGLAIVKHILQRHGGSVAIESTPGKGSTFLCCFPTAKT